MYRVCIILWDGAIIGVYTKEKIINTYPPLFKSAPAQWRVGADFLRGECYLFSCSYCESGMSCTQSRVGPNSIYEYMFQTAMVHTIPEVMKMKQGEQKSTKELEEQAKNVETFNPRWHGGEYLGPNTLRQKADTEVYGKMEEEP